MWKSWLIGAANAIISGLASGIGGLTLGIGWHKALALAFISAFVSLAKWMGQHPLPGSPPDSSSSGPAGQTGARSNGGSK